MLAFLRRPMGVALLAMSIAALAVAGCGGSDDGGGDGGGESSEASEKLTDVTMRLDWIVDGAAACYYAALDNGYFEDEGLDVDIREGEGSSLSLKLISNKTDDFAVADFGAMAQALTEGIRATNVMGTFQRSPHVIVSMQDSGIEGPEDLAGKKIGASPGESPLQLLPAYLATADLEVDDVQVVNLDPSAKLPALYSGRVDAIVAFATAELPIAEAERPGELATQYYADFGVPGVSSGIIVHPDTVSERPDVVEKFVRGLQRGYEFCRDNPERAADNLAEQFPDAVTPEQAREAVEIVVSLLHTENTEGEPIGKLDPVDAEETLKALRKYGDLEEIRALDEYYADQFTR